MSGCIPAAAGRAVRESPLRWGVGRERGRCSGPSTGSGRTESGSAHTVGSGGCEGGRRRPTPHPCPGFPRSRERRGGVGRRGCWWRWVEGPAAAGRAVREPPLRQGVGEATGVWVGVPRPAPLWIPAFAGTTMGGAGRRGVLVAVGPPSSALRTGFDRLRANGVGERACEMGSGDAWGTETPPAAPLPWIPAFAGRTMGVCGSAKAAGGGVRSRCGGTGGSRTAPTRFGESGIRRGFGWGCAAPRPCPGFPRSREGRWGCAGRRRLLVVG